MLGLHPYLQQQQQVDNQVGSDGGVSYVYPEFIFSRLVCLASLIMMARSSNRSSLYLPIYVDTYCVVECAALSWEDDRNKLPSVFVWLL